MCSGRLLLTVLNKFIIQSNHRVSESVWNVVFKLFYVKVTLGLSLQFWFLPGFNFIQSVPLISLLFTVHVFPLYQKGWTDVTVSLTLVRTCVSNALSRFNQHSCLLSPVIYWCIKCADSVIYSKGIANIKSYSFTSIERHITWLSRLLFMWMLLVNITMSA